MNEPFSGIIVPSITPYKADRSLDREGFAAVLRYFDSLPALDGIFVAGATGEYDLLTVEEHKDLLLIASESMISKAWIPNTTTRWKDSSLEVTRYARSLGIHTIGAIIPSECRTFAEVQGFVRQLASQDVQIFIYQTGNSPYPLAVEELAELCREFPIVGIKDSCSPQQFYRHLRYITELGRQIRVIQGVEMLYLSSLVMGGHGVIGGGCNVYPHLLQNVLQYYRESKLEVAAEEQKKVNRLVEILYQEGNGNECMKFHLAQRGVPVEWHSRRDNPAISEQQKIAMESMH